MTFPAALSNLVDNVDVIHAAHINNIEADIGITTDRAGWFASKGSVATDVTGGGQTVDPVVIDTEVFDTGADFDSSVFTAPRTGRYLLIGQVTWYQAGASHGQSELYIVTSNRTYQSWGMPYASFGAGYGSQIIATVADMDAGDTAKLTAEVSNDTQTIDILASMRTFFCGAWLGAIS